MNRGENSDSIPIDLILEILSRLPSKSIARFRCLSKLWGSMLRQPYFTELFLTRSSARPRLLIGIRSQNVCGSQRTRMRMKCLCYVTLSQDSP
ncbi:F-box protein At1g31080-like isoform X2 [Arabidopsis lyrata subsp. lyrata]|uniref:F-box protein At1g31080-like isoform X2 n=1 Tax=Arabidopsis lyrata subsp. lyrata TaxID=81972 RepID=UPI000A29A8D3|nr:F-box protein At1g31080-like isoform X2 [Arabidopsis lyrata subsp. lyrata]|eukprot:XP_020866668.1 F-box protein At1g31080-like isoform X2 [Arabidopsis lyrata subsp. lyrata]